MGCCSCCSHSQKVSRCNGRECSSTDSPCFFFSIGPDKPARSYMTDFTAGTGSTDRTGLESFGPLKTCFQPMGFTPFYNLLCCLICTLYYLIHTTSNFYKLGNRNCEIGTSR